MRIAFYAPLKPIDHPVPSGDRLMARAFFGLLRGLGHRVEVASRFRTFDRTGDAAHQHALEAAAAAEAARLLDGYGRSGPPDLWFTYHAYHKAPDQLGPQVSRACRVPYVIAEASIAGKQAGGPWDRGHRATIEAVDAASAVLAMTRVDARNLEIYLNDPAKLVVFPPFLCDPIPPALDQDRDRDRDRGRERERLARELDLPADTVWLASVAMMRADVKCRSYRLLAEAVARLERPDWGLLVVGDGPAGPEIRRMLRAVAGERVRFLGERPPEAVAALLLAADVFAWPGLQEAYGMAILEALAAGLPVVACDEGGIGDLVAHGRNGYLAAGRSPVALAANLDRLIGDADLRRRMGRAAASLVAERHSLAAAEARLAQVLARVVGGAGPRDASGAATRPMPPCS